MQNPQYNKAIRLTEFLTRITDLQRKSIKDIDDYQQVLWLHNIPKLKGCFTQAWGANKEIDESIWIEVQSRREPPLPKIPNVFHNWIDPDSINEKTEIPLLNESVNRKVKNQNWTHDSDQPEFFYEVVQLKDHPEIEKKWEHYIEEQWIPWTEEHNQWELIQNVYSKLFTIYQEQQKLGEEYELVIGIGLLTWQMPDNQQIHRHIIVANAVLDFDSKLGKFTVRSGIDGANLRHELDMLENVQPPKSEGIAKQELESAEDNPWSRKATDSVLQSITHLINSNGEYYSRLKPEAIRNTDKPIVEYAPALILRKRSVRGLTETLKKIKEQIEVGEIIPDEFKDLAEIIDSSKTRLENDEIDYYKSNNNSNAELYFAKPSNKEQRQIINKINQTNGVLVQGPPGTGKSHTIANLICHLLANGKRILVTAKTPRALQVIEMQLPSLIHPLCVNLLGSGPEERRSLEKSINSILLKTQNWQAEESQEYEQDLKDKISNLRKEKVVIEKRLFSIREAESYSQIIVDGTYKGTAAQIVHMVKTEEPKYNWFDDNIHFDVPCPVENQEMLDLLNWLRALTLNKKQELELFLPEILPNTDELINLFSTEAQLKNKESKLINDADINFLEQLNQQNKLTIDSILRTLTLLQTNLRKLQALPYNWVKNALTDIVSGHEATWNELYSVTEKSLNSIANLVRDADIIEITYLSDLDVKLLYQDAERLHEYLLNGGKLGWGPFCSSTVRPLLYITKNILVNGRKCRTCDELSLLIKLLRVQFEINKLLTFWKGKINGLSGPYILQYHELHTHFSALEEVLDASKTMLKCQNVIYSFYNEAPPLWKSDKYINSFIQSCKLALVQNAEFDINNKITESSKPIELANQQLNAHPIVSKLLEVINNRSTENLHIFNKKLQEIKHEKEMMAKADAVLNNLSNHAPQLAKALAETAKDTSWDERLREFKNAWNWARAQSWLNDYINKEDVASLNDRLLQIESEIETSISKLAAEKAWSFCFSRMSESHRRYMEAWQYHMNKFGKGTGKYAPYHRREAQANLDQCKDAVPVWVMPLYRVWDTISPSPYMFDVIIVDEASQCGLESLPLFYMGKKILIVGDDKQISPDAVGIPQDAVHRLMEEYLHDFNFKTSFDITSSLFYQAKLRYSSQKVVLREHFRCMPEIIRFSNDLCYSAQPLIPLRQYGTNRLKPLQKVYVQEGYREGTGNRVINRPEAEAIVNKIVELCYDSHYTNKTMGVVILQGEAQSILIETLLLGKLGAEEMEQRRIICGNPYSFQGDERDVIFLSMVAAPNERIGTLSKPSDERRFNVAASRAKDQMWLFHSVTPNDLSKLCYRFKLLEFFEQTKIAPITGVDKEQLEKKAFSVNRSEVKAPKPFDSWFEVDVALCLARKKYHVIPQFEVAGKYIDLVIDGGGARLAVECDGDAVHGIENYDKDMEREKILRRCGWPFFRIRESEFYANKESVLDKLFKVLENHHIFPIDMEVATNEFKSATHFLQSEEESHDSKKETPQTETFGTVNLFESTITDNPKDIHEALQMNYPTLRDAIIATLKLRPNQSCVKKSLVKYLLQYFEIISRGKPRETFAYKVNQILNKMAESGILKIYTAKNQRVKLATEPYLSIAIDKDIHT